GDGGSEGYLRVDRRSIGWVGSKDDADGGRVHNLGHSATAGAVARIAGIGGDNRMRSEGQQGSCATGNASRRRKRDYTSGEWAAIVSEAHCPDKLHRTSDGTDGGSEGDRLVDGGGICGGSERDRAADCADDLSQVFVAGGV